MRHVRYTDAHPKEGDSSRGDCQFLRRKQCFDMSELRVFILGRITVDRGTGQGSEVAHSKGDFLLVHTCDFSQGSHSTPEIAVGDKPFGGFFHFHEEDPNACHDEANASDDDVLVSPAHVLVA